MQEYIEKEVDLNPLEVINKASVALTDNKRRIKARSDYHIIIEGGRSKKIFLIPFIGYMISLPFAFDPFTEGIFLLYFLIIGPVITAATIIYYFLQPIPNIVINVQPIGDKKSRVVAKTVGKSKDKQLLEDFINSLPLPQNEKI